MIRSHRPGDIGWIIHRHDVLYAQEYGWNETFEALVATVAAEFIQRYTKIRLWTNSVLVAARRTYERAGTA